jgi:GDPmannose 4,6-dehydratase
MKIENETCAVVTGITGQDAFYLTQKLLGCGVRVIGTTRNTSKKSNEFDNTLSNNLSIVEWDLLDQKRFGAILEEFQPAFIFNLAGMSSGADMNKDMASVAKVNGYAVLNMLESINRVCPETKLVQASSAEIFRGTKRSPQSELCCRAPKSAYGVAKVFADSFLKLFREEYGTKCGSAILYNHESPRRQHSFVTRKITSAAAAISVGKMDTLILGNLSARRDWGHAKDYADGMWRAAQADQMDDYIFATGTTHTVREFVELAFLRVGIELNWIGQGLNEAGICCKTGELRVAVAEKYYRPIEEELLVGDATKARIQLGWEPTVTFEELVNEMVDAELRELSINLVQKNLG